MEEGLGVSGCSTYLPACLTARLLACPSFLAAGQV